MKIEDQRPLIAKRRLTLRPARRLAPSRKVERGMLSPKRDEVSGPSSTISLMPGQPVAPRHWMSSYVVP